MVPCQRQQRRQRDERSPIIEVGIYTRRRPDTVRAADVVFISTERAARNADPHGFFEVPPELVVEIMSPGDTFAEIGAKATEYLDAGVQVVLVLDPRTRTARLCRPGRQAAHLSAAAVFEAPDVLPGVSLPVARFFDET